MDTPVNIDGRVHLLNFLLADLYKQIHREKEKRRECAPRLHTNSKSHFVLDYCFISCITYTQQNYLSFLLGLKKKEKEKEKRRSSFESEGALEVLCGLRVIEPVYNGNVNISDVLKL